MRIIFDTVVLVRGLIGPYSPWGQLVFDYAAAYELVVSQEIVQEYLDVLQRPRIARKYKPASGRDLTTMLNIISKATAVRPSHVPSVCRDPEDDKFLAAAEASNADFIVSADNDLLSLAEYKGARIRTAEAVLRELGRDPR